MNKLLKNRIRIASYIISVFLIILIGIKIFDLIKTKVLQPNRKIGVGLVCVGDGDIVLGNKKAGKSIFMYGNYQCSHCINFFNETLPRLEKDYLNSGKVNLVYKIVPLSTSKVVLDAYKAALCINEFGDFKKFHAMLLYDFNLVYTDEYHQLINEVMSKNEAIAQCIFDRKYDTFTNNKKDFLQLKMKGTPTFVIDNVIIQGNLDYSKITPLIDKLLTN